MMRREQSDLQLFLEDMQRVHDSVSLSGILLEADDDTDSFGDDRVDRISKSVKDISDKIKKVSQILNETMPSVSESLNNTLQGMPKDSDLTSLSLRGDAKKIQKTIESVAAKTTTAALTLAAVTDTFLRVGKILGRSFNNLKDDEKKQSLLTLLSAKNDKLPSMNDLKKGLQVTIPTWAQNAMKAASTAWSQSGSNFFSRFASNMPNKINVDSNTFVTAFLNLSPNDVANISKQLSPVIVAAKMTVTNAEEAITPQKNDATSQQNPQQQGGEQAKQNPQQQGGEQAKQDAQQAAVKGETPTETESGVLKSIDDIPTSLQSSLDTWTSNLPDSDKEKAKDVLDKSQTVKKVSAAQKAAKTYVKNLLAQLQTIDDVSKLKGELSDIFPVVNESRVRLSARTLSESLNFTSEEDVKRRGARLAGFEGERE